MVRKLQNKIEPLVVYDNRSKVETAGLNNSIFLNQSLMSSQISGGGLVSNRILPFKVRTSVQNAKNRRNEYGSIHSAYIAVEQQSIIKSSGQQTESKLSNFGKVEQTPNFKKDSGV